jgi:hypothetical protein
MVPLFFSPVNRNIPVLVIGNLRPSRFIIKCLFEVAAEVFDPD